MTNDDVTKVINCMKSFICISAV